MAAWRTRKSWFSRRAADAKPAPGDAAAGDPAAARGGGGCGGDGGGASDEAVRLPGRAAPTGPGAAPMYRRRANWTRCRANLPVNTAVRASPFRMAMDAGAEM